MSYFKIKKIDKCLLGNFVTTFCLLCGLVLFVMVIQHFFIFLKDITGKGLGWDIYLKLMFYLGSGILPTVFPVAVLMASLIVFGNFSESCELTAMRSVGLSLQRILKYPFLFILLLSYGLFYFQHYIHPNTMPNVFALIHDVCEKKADLFIQEGIFCNNIPGYAIRVNKKGKNGAMEGVIIYDRTHQYGVVSITTAESGLIYTSPDGNELIMELSNGHNYVELFPSKSTSNDSTADTKKSQSFYRSNYQHQKIKIGLNTNFRNVNRDYTESAKTRIYPALEKMIQERKEEVTQEERYDKRILVRQKVRYTIQPPAGSPNGQQEPSEQEVIENSARVKQFMELKTHAKDKVQDSLLEHLVKKALYRVSQIQHRLTTQKNCEFNIKQKLWDTLYEKQHRFALSIRCIVMFLLAAPLGCIIKKGGFGISVVISAFFILLEYMLSIVGKEMALEGECSPFFGACFADIILIPFCCYFLLKAQAGLSLSPTEYGYKLLGKLRRKKKKELC
ncbi:MAG: LptF/LptG family permease [Amoebophilaceae bacterium]|nr:LptF/LptG family permease [Amoebophilaceae bacterium]